MSASRDSSIDVLIHPVGELATPYVDSGSAHGKQMGELRRVKDAAVAIRAGAIVAAGPAQSVLAEFRPTDNTVLVDATGKLVTPGLVDPHTHLIFAGNRANEFIMRCQGKKYLEIAAAGGGIVASMKATRSASLPELVRLGKSRLKNMLHTGTTTCEVKTGYGLDLESELRMLEAVVQLSALQPVELVPTFMPAHAVPPECDRATYVDQIITTMLPQVARQYLADSEGRLRDLFNDVFCDQGYFTVDETRRILEAGAKLGLKPKVHADEFANLGATSLAVELKAASADHLLNVSDAEIALLAQSDTVAVLLPGTSFFLNLSEHAPARKLIDSGAAVALGSDFNPGSCHIFSLPLIWGLSCMHLRMTPEEALTALTINAAYAVGRGDRLGQIRPGFQADIVIFAVGQLEEIPYNLGWNPVSMTLKRGEIVAEN
jgi:imidazolonepropionase